MRKTKVFGAMLCSAALAMGMAMPAFAVAGADGESQFDIAANGTDTQATSNVKAEVSKLQINAKVPMNVTVTMIDEGGAFTTVPSPGVYCITNGGNAPIKVTGVKAAASDKWGILDKLPATKPSTTTGTIGDYALAINGVAINADTAVSLDGNIVKGTPYDLTITGGAYPKGNKFDQNAYTLTTLTFTVAKA